MSEPEFVPTPPQLPPPLIVRSRIKALAQAHGKVASTTFLNLIDQEVRQMVADAVHMVGSRKIIKAGEFRDYRTLLKSYGGGRKK